MAASLTTLRIYSMLMDPDARGAVICAVMLARNFTTSEIRSSTAAAIHIRGKPSKDKGSDITANVFPRHGVLSLCCGLLAVVMDSWTDEAILLDNNENVEIKDNITKTDTYSKYYSQCDFDGDGIDDLFLATGTTWWFSSSGKFHWT